jgi:molybdopterin synthase catalytic subunit
MSVVALLEQQRLDPQRELGELLGQPGDDGAVVSFVGIARRESMRGAGVDELLLEHHPVLTLKSIEEIAVEAAERFDVSRVRVVHRCGRVAAGEPIVFAGAASKHRRAAFEAADYLMDRLKTEAVFWKRETGAEGSAWIEPTEADYADRDRWG